MLTTETPAAQLFSMPSSAASPPKLAPYRCWWARRSPAPSRARRYARQRAFHAGHDDDRAGRRSAAHVRRAADGCRRRRRRTAGRRCSHHFRGDARFLGNRKIRGARGGDQNCSAARLNIVLTVRDGTGDGMKCGAGNLLHCAKRLLAGTRDEQRVSARDDLGGDRARSVRASSLSPNTTSGKP